MTAFAAAGTLVRTALDLLGSVDSAAGVLMPDVRGQIAAQLVLAVGLVVGGVLAMVRRRILPLMAAAVATAALPLVPWVAPVTPWSLLGVIVPAVIVRLLLIGAAAMRPRRGRPVRQARWNLPAPPPLLP